MAAAQYHFRFPTDAAARAFVYDLTRQVRTDMAIYRDGRDVIVLDGSGRDRRAELLAITVRLDG